MDSVYALGTIPLTAAAGGKALVGDIDGDGVMETVFIKGDSGLDYRYVPHQVASASAYRRGGGVLPGLYDSEQNRIAEFGTEGYVVHADFFGRGISDVLIYTPTQAVLYSGKYCDVAAICHEHQTALKAGNAAETPQHVNTLPGQRRRVEQPLRANALSCVFGFLLKKAMVY